MPRKQRRTRLRPKPPSRTTRRTRRTARAAPTGASGSTILGILLLLVGGLLLSGASLGAVLRRSGHQVHAHVKGRRSRRPAVVEDEPPPKPARTRSKPVVDAEEAYPDVVVEAAPP